MGKDLHGALAREPYKVPSSPIGLKELCLSDRFLCVPEIQRSVVLQIASAALNADRFEAEEALLTCLESGLSAEELIDTYIPHVARLLGDAWCEDLMGFAEVTIGVARLQGHVRMLDMRTHRPKIDAIKQPSVLLAVAPECYHTLGPMIALSQFRRLGASVRLLLTHSSDDLLDAMNSEAYDLVALTATAHEKLDTLRDFVDIIRQTRDTAPPVVVGGSILDVEPETHILVGADHAARTPEEAYTLCGLTIPTYDADYCVKEA